MSDKKKKKKKAADKLAKIASKLKQQELAIDQKTKHLEELIAELEQKKRSEKKKKETADAATPADTGKSPQVPSARNVAEISEMMQSVFNGYSDSAHKISSQLSTVTAAVMCEAVASVLENRSFDAKDAFLKELKKTLHSDGMKPDATPSYIGNRTIGKSETESEQVAEAMPMLQPKPISAPVPLFKPQPLIPQMPMTEPQPLSESAPDETDDTPLGGDDILRIDSVIEFQKLGERGLRNNESIVRVVLPEGIQYLPGSFFYGCSNLQEIWLPDSLLEIGPQSFYGCKSLTAVHLGERSAMLEIGEYAFAMCEALSSFTVPAQVEALGTSVFRFCTSLKELTFAGQHNLRTIGSHLLHNCTSLKELILPDSVTIIPLSMCYGCTQLHTVVAEGADTIEDHAFYDNEDLLTVRIRSRKTIATQAFEGCGPELTVEYVSAPVA